MATVSTPTRTSRVSSSWEPAMAQSWASPFAPSRIKTSRSTPRRVSSYSAPSIRVFRAEAATRNQGPSGEHRRALLAQVLVEEHQGEQREGVAVLLLGEPVPLVARQHVPDVLAGAAHRRDDLFG